MATIQTPSYVTGITGKVCGHEKNEYRTNHTSGKITLCKKCHPYNGPATESQLKVRADFMARTAAVRKWLDDNRPTEAQPKGTALYQEAVKIKKGLMLDNILSALSQYQARTAPFAILLPSQGGTRQKNHDNQPAVTPDPTPAPAGNDNTSGEGGGF